ncbi:hypothetical protein TNCV_639251 [Trichonephila clavipes]|nr:hypothetical protein TNCV_639251 [Trichonephila clavipes]
MEWHAIALIRVTMTAQWSSCLCRSCNDSCHHDSPVVCPQHPATTCVVAHATEVVSPKVRVGIKSLPEYPSTLALRLAYFQPNSE